MRSTLLAALLLVLVGRATAEETATAPRSVLEDFDVAAQLRVDISEISGLCPVTAVNPPAGSQGRVRTFLAVSDDARATVDAKVVVDGLFRLRVGVADDGQVAVDAVTPIELQLGDHIEHVDPTWARFGGWHADLESCVALPGTSDLYVLGGERGAEDASDGGANRLYVVRYPAGNDATAKLVAYFRLPDTGDDTINDRFEAVAATPGVDAATWAVFAMKERTAAPDKTPTYFPLSLRQQDDAFQIGFGNPRAMQRLPALHDDPARLSSQADACRDVDGRVWVLDRWRRQIHIARVEEGMLVLQETLDLFPAVKAVQDETGVDEPAAPGSDLPGYGRHEAMTFDAWGWLWLAADLGGNEPSVVTALAPKSK